MTKYSLWNTGHTIMDAGIAHWYEVNDCDELSFLNVKNGHAVFDTPKEAADFMRTRLIFNNFYPLSWVIAEYDSNRNSTNTKTVIGYFLIPRDSDYIPLEYIILESK